MIANSSQICHSQAAPATLNFTHRKHRVIQIAQGGRNVQDGRERIADGGKVEYTGCKEGKVIRDNSVSTILGKVFVFLLGFAD